MSTKTIISESPEQTRDIAKALLSDYPDTSVIALDGELGAGKTCFVQGLAAALGITEPITSPTFTIVNEYTGTRGLCHMDLYRMTSPDEVLALGFEEFIASDRIIAIEWPDRADELMPNSTIHIHLASLENENERSITIRTDSND